MKKSQTVKCNLKDNQNLNLEPDSSCSAELKQPDGENRESCMNVIDNIAAKNLV